MRLLELASKVVVAVVLLAATLVSASTPAEARRVALVIGNGNYQAVGLLKNPANDANALGAALKRIAFDDVLVAVDADQAAMRQKLGEFSRIAQDADLALVFYAGHGIEVAGENYLIPIDARIGRSKDVEFETVPLRQVQSTVEDIKGTGIIILDACRNNPYIARMIDPGGHRAIGVGLGRPLTRGRSTMIFYSARDGTVASDGSGSNSPFTTALLKFVDRPLEIDFLFRQVRDEVIAATGPDEPQEPFTYGSLGAQPIYLVPPPEKPEPGKLQREPSLDEYRMQFRTAVLDPKWDKQIDFYRQRIAAARDRYEVVSAATGVPWFVIGILHMAEAGGNFRAHLHNGDPLTARTVTVPAGRPKEGNPPFTWEASAIDAIRFEKWDVRTKLWTVEDTLSAFERFNGLAMRRKGLVTPYLWAGTNLYVKGKYVADGVFDPDAVSKQIGAGTLLKYAIPVQDLERNLNWRGGGE